MSNDPEAASQNPLAAGIRVWALIFWLWFHLVLIFFTSEHKPRQHDKDQHHQNK